jgi:hypothetical protein
MPHLPNPARWSDGLRLSFNDGMLPRQVRALMNRQISRRDEIARQPIEPFRKSPDLFVLGDCNFQFYGSTAGRIYSAQAVLLFLSSGLNLFIPSRVLFMKRVDPPILASNGNPASPQSGVFA